MQTAAAVSGKYDTVVSDAILEKTARALEHNGMRTIIASSAEDAREAVRRLIPPQAEVMDMTSQTLRTLGIAQEINESGRYNAVRPLLRSLDPKTQLAEKQKAGAAPEWTIGSVHACTEDGQLLVASNTGSQLPAYAYGARHVILVIGAQKVVRSLDEGMNRINEHSFPLENERALHAYGTSSFPSKILLVNREVQPGRVTVILVKERLGY
jgi:L-lactate utilization protein LutC